MSPVGAAATRLPVPATMPAPDTIATSPRLTAPPVKTGLGRRLGTVVLLVALMTALLLAVPGLRDVVRKMGDMSPGWLVLAVALELASCLSFVVIFRLFFDEIPAARAREVAWTEMASGALLPGGGVGGLAVGGWLMHLAGMPARRIVRRSSGLFFLTSAVNVGTLIGAALLLATGDASGPHDFARSGLPLIAGVGVLAFFVALPLLWRHRTHHRDVAWVHDVVAGITEAVHELTHPSWRLLGAIGFLGFDIAVLWATFSAVGHVPPGSALILAYLIGYLANLIPLPGGIGALDAGVAGALVLYGAPPAQAAAAVLAYHAIAFWIPGVGGMLGYTLARRRLTAAATSPTSSTGSELPRAPALRTRRSAAV